MIEAFLGPLVAGAKVTQIVQLIPAVSDVPQLVNSENSLAFGPVSAILLIGMNHMLAVRETDREIVLVVLVPVFRVPKLTLPGDTVTLEAVAADVTVTDTGAERLAAYVLLPE